MRILALVCVASVCSGCLLTFRDVPIPKQMDEYRDGDGKKTFGEEDGKKTPKYNWEDGRQVALDSKDRSKLYPTNTTAFAVCSAIRNEARAAVTGFEVGGFIAGGIGILGSGALAAEIARNDDKAPSVNLKIGLATLLAGSSALVGLATYLFSQAGSARSTYWQANGALAQMYGNVPALNAASPDVDVPFKRGADWQACSKALQAIGTSQAAVDTGTAGAMKLLATTPMPATPILKSQSMVGEAKTAALLTAAGSLVDQVDSGKLTLDELKRILKLENTLMPFFDAKTFSKASVASRILVILEVLKSQEPPEEKKSADVPTK